MRGFTLAGFFCLSVLMDWTTGMRIELIPPHPLVNQSVLFNVTQISGSVRTYSWFKGERAISTNLILGFNVRNNPPETPGPLHFPRVSSFPNSSLEISNLYTEDQGYYTVQVGTVEAQERSTVQLLVYEKVTKPVIHSSTLIPIKNETVRLTCDTMNSEEIRWGRSGKALPPGVIQSSDNRVITFPNIKPGDAGLYWCEAENLVSKMTSDFYTLNVYCICGSDSELNAGQMSGIIIGTILGLVLLFGGVFLLLYFQRHKHPAREEPRETANKTQDPPIEYYNVQATPGPYPASQESAYMDLQYSSQDMYSDLQS